MKTQNKVTIHPNRFHDFGKRTTRETLFTERASATHKQFIKQFLHEPPPPKGDPEFDLGRIIGDKAVSAIQADGEIIFHATGDTGKGTHSAQEDVALAMAADCPVTGKKIGPAFFLHLGDVTYGPDKETALYRTQFYEPYTTYPRKIIGIAGNHEGDSYPQTDPEPLTAFLKYFADDAQNPVNYNDGVPHSTMNLPGVYWRMRCPFIDIIGLYSNRLEDVGMIEGGQPKQGTPVTETQKTFFTAALKTIAAERAAGKSRALVIAVHHPAFSGGGHIGSADMLDDMDDCCKKAKIMPDAVLSAHAHNYQRFTRKLNFGGKDMRIPHRRWRRRARYNPDQSPDRNDG
jgi:Calcineurin-like phosphoesterase